MRPGRQPLRRLAEALLDDRVLGDRWSAVVRLVAAALALGLECGPLSLAELAAESPPPGERKLLLLVDQFEEVFRYRAGRRSRRGRHLRGATCWPPLGNGKVPIYVILTMRSDYIGESAVFDGLPEAFNDSLYLTPRLTGTSATRRSRARLRCSTAGSSPTWSHACSTTWAPAQTAAPDAARPDAAVEGRPPGRIGRRGVRPDTRPPTRPSAASRGPCPARPTRPSCRSTKSRRIAGPSSAASVNGPRSAATSADRPSRGGRPGGRGPARGGRRRGRRLPRSRPCFLTPPWPERVGAETWLDISHESLIRQWDRLQAWVEDEADSAEVYRRLDQRAARWSEGGPPSGVPLTSSRRCTGRRARPSRLGDPLRRRI